MLHDKFNRWPIPKVEAGNLYLQEHAQLKISFYITYSHFTECEWDTIKVLDKPITL